jgi:hypothetical protein
MPMTRHHDNRITVVQQKVATVSSAAMNSEREVRMSLHGDDFHRRRSVLGWAMANLWKW